MHQHNSHARNKKSVNIKNINSKYANPNIFLNNKGKICYDLSPMLLTENTKKEHTCCVPTTL